VRGVAPRPGTDGRPGSVAAPAASTVVHLIESQVRATPDVRAVDDGLESWSYEQLWSRASAIASRLDQAGVGRGQAVGLCLPRTNSAVAAIVGVLMAGAAYVPLDPAYPADRLAAMCARVAMPIVLGPPALTAALPHEALTLDVEALDLAAGAFSGPGPEPGDPAYILFTSGSTGTPKGVQVSHGNVMALLWWVRQAFDPSELSLVAASTSFNFDPSVLELFAPLSTGGALRLVPDALALAAVDDPVTLVASPPSVVAELVRARRFPSTVETLLVGGEVLSPSLATELLGTGGVRRLVNCYGPTEATVMVTAHEVRLPVESPISIGREIDGTDVLLLDDEGAAVAPGVVGELWIAGPQVADGYVGDPELTGSRFATEVRHDGTARRRYRTGDLARRRPDGSLEFHGRRDQQLKVRGFRIEPGDVERALEAQPGVAQAAVTAARRDAQARLVAYFVPGPEPTDATRLREGLRAVLPAYLVPTECTAVPSLPLTTTGKLDRRALATRAEHGEPPAHLEREEPTTTETGPGPGPARRPDPTQMDADQVTVARLAAQVLGRHGPIFADDDFFDDLGGTSLAMVHLLSLLEQAWSCRLPVGRILADTSIAGVAALAGVEVGGEPSGADLLRVNPGGTRPPLFLIHAYLGSVLRYRRLGPALSPDQPLVGIHVHDLEGDTTTRVTVEDLAARAVARIRSVRPRGPYVVGGHSAGGLVAYEAARRLRREGDEVTQVLLIDTPARVSLARYYWGELVLNWPERGTGTPAHWAVAARAIVASRLSLRRPASASDGVDAAVERAGRLSNLAVRNHATSPYDGDVTVLHTLQGTRMSYGDRTLGWDRFVRGDVRCLAIPGGHNTLFDPPHLATVAATIAELLDELSAGPRAYPTDPGAPAPLQPASTSWEADTCTADPPPRST
jgi:amino acid adenylation domain-containing protein